MRKYKSMFKENYVSKISTIKDILEELQMIICGNEEDAGKIISRPMTKKVQAVAPAGSTESDVYFFLVEEALTLLETRVQNVK